MRTIGRNLTIRKTGARGFDWRVTCPDCVGQGFRDLIHFTSFGAVAVNDRGIGNRTHQIAVSAATEHLRQHVEGRFS